MGATLSLLQQSTRFVLTMGDILTIVGGVVSMIIVLKKIYDWKLDVEAGHTKTHEQNCAQGEVLAALAERQGLTVDRDKLNGSTIVECDVCPHDEYSPDSVIQEEDVQTRDAIEQ